MPESDNAISENESGAFGDLAARPNPRGLVVLQIPPFEEMLPFIENDLGRKLTPAEAEIQQRKLPALVVSKDVAERMLALRAKSPALVIGARRRSPRVKSTYNELPTEPADRNEAAVDLLGQHLFWLRNHLIERLQLRVESEESRKQLASVHRKEFDAVAALQPESRDAAFALARKAIDLYLQDTLALLTGSGDSLRFGIDHAINYLLLLQVKEISTDQVVEEFEVNRQGKKVFSEYFGRWLNRHGDHQ